MPSETYQAFGLIPDKSDFTLDALEKRLRDRWSGPFPERVLTRHGDRLRIADPSRTFHIVLVEGDHVAGESAELATRFRGHPLAPVMAACRKRVEMYTADRDSEELMGWFHGICNAVNGFAGVVVVNLTDREVLDKEGP